jgi:hypothetical protein
MKFCFDRCCDLSHFCLNRGPPLPPSPPPSPLSTRQTVFQEISSSWFVPSVQCNLVSNRVKRGNCTYRRKLYKFSIRSSTNISLKLIIYIFNRSWVDTRWQQYITHSHTNSTHNTEKRKQYRERTIGKCGSCQIFASYTLAFALQLKKKHGKTSVRVAQY